MEMMFTSSILLEINMILGLGCFTIWDVLLEFIVLDEFLRYTNND